MRDTSRLLTQSECQEAVKLVHDYVVNLMGDNYLWNISEVVETMVVFAITRSAPDPGSVLNYWDRKVRVVSELVARFMTDEYRGIAQYGLLERCQHLLKIAHNT